jgi:hypothetical protein
MFMAFHASPERKPVWVAAALSLLLLGLGIALSFG